jgi:hypothetical protein
MMATEALEPNATTWDELAAQTLLTHSLGQVECGYTTHVNRFGACPWCGAAL